MLEADPNPTTTSFAALATLAHDIKNPLTTIRGYAHLLRLRSSKYQCSPLGLDDALGRIEASANLAAILVEQMLASARFREQSSILPHPTPVDLVELTRRVAADAQERSCRPTLRVEIGEPELVGFWDGAQIRRVLENLVDNAIKYSPAGTMVVLTVRREESLPVGWALLNVRDHGLGIPEADLPRIFAPFFRGSNVAGGIAGSGLGLASVKEIVDQLGGNVIVESQEGKGTAFTVRLPLVPQEGI